MDLPRPGDLAPGETFNIPDDALFTPDGRHIIVTQEDDFVISLTDIATHRIVGRYGPPGVPGSGPNQLWNPGDAIALPNGDVLAADIKNCRLLIIGPADTLPNPFMAKSVNAATRHRRSSAARTAPLPDA